VHLRTSLLALALAAVSLACPACSDEAPEPGAARPLVVVSVGPHRYFVERLAGDAVEVVSLLPPGASPTSFEPGIETLRILERAQLLVRVGHPHFPFERAWFDGLLRARGGRYFVEDRLTVADLKVYVWVQNLRSGVLDHVPVDLCDVQAATLVEHHARIHRHPGVVAYYEGS